jgi:hypothetical protein
MATSLGCYMCHRALTWCDMWISPKLRFPHLRDSSVIDRPYPLCLLDYPQTEDEVLSTWESRASLWETHRDSFWFRKFRCGLYDSSEPISYSKYDSYDSGFILIIELSMADL